MRPEGRIINSQVVRKDSEKPRGALHCRESPRKRDVYKRQWVYDTINGDDGGSIEFVPNTNYNGKYAATADKMHWDCLLYTSIDDLAEEQAASEPERLHHGRLDRRRRRVFRLRPVGRRIGQIGPYGRERRIGGIERDEACGFALAGAARSQRSLTVSYTHLDVYKRQPSI